jgi:hypothetical protein
MGAIRNAYKILVRIPGKRSLGTGETGWEGVDWIHLAQDRFRVKCNIIFNIIKEYFILLCFFKEKVDL